ncbi:MAG: tetratricopeptide repeat protein [Anaerolineales bacterium]|nr:tetratricopeptide repeat protein [Anaerolineales bacterium]
MEHSDIQKLLQQGIAVAKMAHGKQPLPPGASKGDLQQRARNILRYVTELDPTNLQAWLWLSTVAEDNSERYFCLETVLTLDPANKVALTGLEHLHRQAQIADDDTLPPETSLRFSQEEHQLSRYKRIKPAAIPASPTQRPPAQTSRPQPQPSTGGCPFCQQPVSKIDTICPHCQLPLVVECPDCKTKIDVEWDRCPECHHRLGDYRAGATYFIQLADDYRQHHRGKNAIEALHWVERLDPEQPGLYQRRGEVLAELGQSDEAVAVLRDAIKREPEVVGLYLSLGHVLRQGRHFTKAATTYAEAIDRSPKTAEAHFALGDLYLERGQPKEASRYLAKATHLAPQEGLAWARLGRAYEELQQFHPAVKAYQQAVRYLSPELVEWKRSRERLNILSPDLPEGLVRGWSEFLRQVAGPILVCVLALLLDSGLRPWWIHWSGWLALLLAMFGAFLWVSATSLPQNPLICLVAGQQGLEAIKARPVIAAAGIFFWVVALSIILMPIYQSLPETPS